MAYAAWSTAGMTLSVTISSVVTAIPGVENIAVSPGQKPQIDTTAISDTSSSSVVGVQAPGTLTFNVMWDPGNNVHQYLLMSYNIAGSVNDAWTVTCQDTGDAVLTFNGYVQDFSLTFDKNGTAKAAISVSLSSAVSVAP
jgi:hypothetical protein